jgi:hypothetical protein
MLRIYSRLVWCVPLFLMLTVALEAYGRVLPQTPDALLDICPFPCLMGITPDLTTSTEVEDILRRALPVEGTNIARRVTLGDVQFSFETLIGGQYTLGYVTLSSTNDLVMSIHLVTVHFPLITLIEKWGAPNCAHVQGYNGVPASGVMEWRHGGYYAQVLFTFQPQNVDWMNARVQALFVRSFVAQCGSGSHAWQGFAPPWRYQ